MITVRLFAQLKEAAGTGSLMLGGSPGTVETLLAAVKEAVPGLASFIESGRLLVAVNGELARPGDTVREGDEVALMPPFSGGQGAHPFVRIQREPFSVEQEVERVQRVSDSIGAVVTFLGTTRDISRGKAVAKLEFEHYAGMAEKALAGIRERAIRDFGVIEVSIVHRIGTIPAGENIVLIVVASGHRDEAFRACRFCIDELKRTAPIWKRETTSDGETWVEEHP